MLTTQPRSVGQTKAAEPQKPQPAKPADVKETKRPDDDAAIRKASGEFSKAFEKGDAKATAAMWTEDGEYIGEDGTTLRGRAAIESAYAKAFEKKKNTKLEITIESIRFPSKDTAIEEGYAKVYKGDSEQPTSSRYSVLHVREGGRWLMAVLREWPDEAVSLRDLDWLIGTWEAKTDEVEVRTVYTWDGKKNSIRCNITIKGKGRIVAATHVLLKDPRHGSRNTVVDVRRRRRIRRRRLDSRRQALGHRGARRRSRRRGTDRNQHPDNGGQGHVHVAVHRTHSRR